MASSVAIVGAGIIGISNALKFLENDFEVTIFTKDQALATNSDAAIATWYAPDDSKPYLQQLCFASLPKFNQLSKDSLSGVSYLEMSHCFRDLTAFNKSCWSKPKSRELFKINVAKNNNFTANPNFPVVINSTSPLVDANIYRPYLLNKFYTNGGKLIINQVSSLAELAHEYNIIINCAGWESKFLTNDPQVYPIRGQVEVAKTDKNFPQASSLNISESNAYLIFRPKSQDCVLGTTYQVNNDSLEANEQDRYEIINKLKDFVPQVNDLTTNSKVGLRCGRNDVKISAEIVASNCHKKALLIHCYGHSSSGYSASWGSADEVFKLYLDHSTELS